MDFAIEGRMTARPLRTDDGTPAMACSLPAFILFASAFLGCAGLILMIMGVRSKGPGVQVCCQRLFTMCLVGVGGATILAVAHQDASWICAAVAYAGLSVGATLDGRGSESFSAA